MIYPINYEGNTQRWYAETVDGALVTVGDIAPNPGAADLALNLAWRLLGAKNVRRVISESARKLEPIAA